MSSVNPPSHLPPSASYSSSEANEEYDSESSNDSFFDSSRSISPFISSYDYDSDSYESEEDNSLPPNIVALLKRSSSSLLSSSSSWENLLSSRSISSSSSRSISSSSTDERNDDSIDLSLDSLKSMFQKALNDLDMLCATDVLKLATDQQKVTLIKLCNTEKQNILHLLAIKILILQNKSNEDKQIVNLRDDIFSILKIEDLKKDLKEIVTTKDSQGYCFLDLAVFFKEPNVLAEILQLIPENDRDECKIEIRKYYFQEKLNAEDLNIALALFYLSQDSQKASLAKIQNEKNQMTLLHLVVMQIYNDIRKKQITTAFFEHVKKILQLIPPTDRKEILTLQNITGRTVLHLAALCPDKNINLSFEILQTIAQEDRVGCLTIQDYTISRWTPLHIKANATTHEDDLNERSIQEILNTLPNENDKLALKEIKDGNNKNYQDIQEKKKKDEKLKKESADGKSHIVQKQEEP